MHQLIAETASVKKSSWFSLSPIQQHKNSLAWPMGQGGRVAHTADHVCKYSNKVYGAISDTGEGELRRLLLISFIQTLWIFRLPLARRIMNMLSMLITSAIAVKLYSEYLWMIWLPSISSGVIWLLLSDFRRQLIYKPKAWVARQQFVWTLIFASANLLTFGLCAWLFANSCSLNYFACGAVLVSVFTRLMISTITACNTRKFFRPIHLQFGIPVIRVMLLSLLASGYTPERVIIWWFFTEALLELKWLVYVWPALMQGYKPVCIRPYIGFLGVKSLCAGLGLLLPKLLWFLAAAWGATAVSGSQEGFLAVRWLALFNWIILMERVFEKASNYDRGRISLGVYLVTKTAFTLIGVSIILLFQLLYSAHLSWTQVLLTVGVAALWVVPHKSYALLASFPIFLYYSSAFEGYIGILPLVVSFALGYRCYRKVLNRKEVIFNSRTALPVHCPQQMHVLWGKRVFVSGDYCPTLFAGQARKGSPFSAPHSIPKLSSADLYRVGWRNLVLFIMTVAAGARGYPLARHGNWYYWVPYIKAFGLIAIRNQDENYDFLKWYQHRTRLWIEDAFQVF